MIKYLEKEEDFNNLIQNRVLVDFYADWCGPCKRLGTILEEINDIDILKVNVDLFQNISNKYGVMSIPTIIIFDKGNEIKKSIGFKTKNELLEFIK
ncbi:thioredoxin [bacterium]|jgi:thioredoxin|nr:thioredoxin [bacterium]